MENDNALQNLPISEQSKISLKNWGSVISESQQKVIETIIKGSDVCVFDQNYKFPFYTFLTPAFELITQFGDFKRTIVAIIAHDRDMALKINNDFNKLFQKNLSTFIIGGTKIGEAVI